MRATGERVGGRWNKVFQEEEFFVHSSDNRNWAFSRDVQGRIITTRQRIRNTSWDSSRASTAGSVNHRSPIPAVSPPMRIFGMLLARRHSLLSRRL